MGTRDTYAEMAEAAIDTAHKAQLEASRGTTDDRVRRDFVAQRIEDSRCWLATAQVYATLASVASVEEIPYAKVTETPVHMMMTLGGEHMQTYCGMRLKLEVAVFVTYRDDYVTCCACRKVVGL